MLSIKMLYRPEEATLQLAGPDAGGEAFDGGEAEALVELDGGMVVGSYGQS